MSSSFSFTIETNSALPEIIPINPVDGEIGVSTVAPIRIRFTHETGIDLDTVSISVNGVYYVIDGVVSGGATYGYSFAGVSISGSSTIVDVVLSIPAPYPSPATQTVSVSVRNLPSLGNLATLTYTFQTGIGVRLVRVDNPREGFLIARFNVPMLVNNAFRYVPNWTATPVTVGAAPIVIDSVQADAGHPMMALLRYTGGASAVYRLTVDNTESAAGDALISPFNQADFTLVFATKPDSTIQLFKTIYGTIGLEKRKVAKRSVDQMVINRAIALGMDEQMRLRLQAIQGTGLPESGGPGARRT